MKILLLCSDFSQLNGVSMYLYTLGKEMVLLGHEVTICSKQGGVMLQNAKEAGIETVEEVDPTRKFDIVHSNQKYDLKYLDFYKGSIVHTIHSEFSSEKPPIDSRIKKFIAIRPKIASTWSKRRAEVVYNPIDFSRFKPFLSEPKEGMVLFVGSIDGLRKEAAMALINSGVKCRFVGKKFDTWADGLDNWFDETWDIEEHLKDATSTAGILLGRTTLEGWACGLPGTIYNRSKSGVVGVETLNPPEDMSLYDSKLVTKQILKIYEE